MDVGDGFCEETDDDGWDEDYEEEDTAEVEIVNLADDVWNRVIRDIAARCPWIRVLPGEADYTSDKADHQAPERTLKSIDKHVVLMSEIVTWWYLLASYVQTCPRSWCGDIY